MELQTLDAAFQPVETYDNYSSLIWTERYATAGDFQMVSYDVPGTMAMFPLESYVTLRESTVPMFVDKYEIAKNPRGAPFIKVLGYSFEKVLMRRMAINALSSSATRAAWMMSANKESDAAYKALRVVLGDVDRSKAPFGIVLPAVAPVVAKDAIPQIDLTLPLDYETGVVNSYEIEFGKLYDVVLGLLAINRRGIKSVRPLPNDTSGKVRVEIYNGADIRELVVFDAKFQNFDDANYQLGWSDSENIGYVFGPGGAEIVFKTSAPEPEGLARRVGGLDLTSDTSANTAAARKTRMLTELYKHNAIALFDGQISVQIASLYNKPVSEGGYSLGDILKLNGEYGLSQNVRVAEFIRSSDNTGEKAYPTFEAIADNE